MTKPNTSYKLHYNPDSKAYIKRKNEAVSERLTLLFVISTFAVIMMLLVQNRGGASSMLVLHNIICPILMILSLGLLGWGIGYSIYGNKNIPNFQTANALKMITPEVCASFGATVFLLSFLYYFVFQKDQNYKTVAAIIVLTALAFIYESFSNDFFAFSFSTALGAVLLLIQSNSFAFTNIRTVFYAFLQIASFLFAAFLIVAVFFLTDKHGNLKIFGKRIPFIGRHAKKWPLVTLGALLLVFNLCTCIINAGFRIYGLIAVGALYLVVCIYYAVKQLSR